MAEFNFNFENSDNSQNNNDFSSFNFQNPITPNEPKKPFRVPKSAIYAGLGILVVLLGFLGFRFLTTPSVPKYIGSTTNAMEKYVETIKTTRTGDYSVLGEYQLTQSSEDREKFITFIMQSVELGGGEITYKAPLGATLSQKEIFADGVAYLKVIDYDKLADIIWTFLRNDVLSEWKTYSNGLQASSLNYRKTLTDFYAKYITNLFTRKFKATTMDAFLSSLPTLKGDDLKKAIEGYNQYDGKIFIDYLDKDGKLIIPYTTVKVKVGYNKDKQGVYTVTDDSAIDTLLFNSESFVGLEDTVGRIVLGYFNNNSVTKEFTDWSTKTIAAIEKATNSTTSNNPLKAASVDLSSYFQDVPYKYEFAVESLSKEATAEYKKAPNSTKNIEIDRNVEGVLPNAFGYVDVKSANGYIPNGDGTFTNPLDLNTEIITTSVNNGVESKIALTLKEVLRGQDAVDYLVRKDERNKGLTANDNKEIAIFIFNVKNGEDKEITINADISLTDKNRTLINRTGKMYGLTESVKLKAGETAEIQDWVLATELDKRYVIWGKSFSRNLEPIWFKVFKAKD